jgi:hypothetical protein
MAVWEDGDLRGEPRDRKRVALEPNVELTGGTRQAALARCRKMNEVGRYRAKDACRGTSG